MCGIAGVNFARRHNEAGNRLLELLLLESASRGKDSSGLATVRDFEIIIQKEPLRIDRFLRLPVVTHQIHRVMSQERLLAFGHSRMETHGSFQRPENNQPVVRKNVVLLHNGIIVNAAELWKQYSGEKPQTDVDSEVIALLISETLERCRSLSINETEALLSQSLQRLEGSYSIAVLVEELNAVLLATNTGSLYVATGREQFAGCIAFASEELFLKRSLASVTVPSLGPISEFFSVKQMPLRRAVFFPFYDATEFKTLQELRANRKIEVLPSEHTSERPRAHNVTKTGLVERIAITGFEQAKAWRKSLKFCTKCIMPETMPFIVFDAQGVCNYCNRYQKRQLLGKEALLREIEGWRRKDSRPECVVSFSGGRDSSYALHLAVKELGLKCVAFSYDWGMLTDLGRRNQARMTGALGVEHVLISADIQMKRENIRKNVAAWLRAPHLGLVPLFMAGDKHYFSYLNRVRRAMNITPSIYADNSLEKSDFKYGFAGVANRAVEKKSYHIGFLNSLKLLGYYGTYFMGNTGYWNSSLTDTLSAYWSSYFEPKNFLHLFKYYEWEEKKIERTLMEDYLWELAPDTSSSWRIGDGTAGFYNYIYYVMGGLTEHDTFRSNQVREGLISREEAMKLAEQGNQPRIESLLWYFDTIGLDAEKALTIVNAHSVFAKQISLQKSPSQASP